MKAVKRNEKRTSALIKVVGVGGIIWNSEVLRVETNKFISNQFYKMSVRDFGLFLSSQGVYKLFRNRRGQGEIVLYRRGNVKRSRVKEFFGITKSL